MKLKKILLVPGFVGLSTIALISCSSKKTTHNDVTPYGALYDKLDNSIAELGENKFTLGEYYNLLRNKGYSLVEDNIKKAIYKDELKAITILYENEYNSLSAEDKSFFENTYKFVVDEDDEPLFTIDFNKYSLLRAKLLENVNKTLAASVYGSADPEAISKLSEDDVYKKIETFVDNKAQEGTTISSSLLNRNTAYSVEGDAAYKLRPRCKIIQFNQNVLDALRADVDKTLLSQAETLSAMKALYKIADEEYIPSENDEDSLTKNANYLYKDDTFKDKYDSTYKTYGHYQIIAIQFNSRREADRYIKALGTDISVDDSNLALNQYLELYKNYYSYKTGSTVSIDDEAFNFEVTELGSDLSEANDIISSFSIDVLDEDGTYLTEARNINNKYVLAYRYKTEYLYHDKDDINKELSWADLDDETKDKLIIEMKEKLLEENASSYIAKNYKKLIEDADIEIYDPIFETKFEAANEDEYDLLDKKIKETDENIFTVNDISYSVADFYKEASKKYAATIIPERFTLEYAYSFYDEYVENYYIDEDNHDDNEETLDKAIDTFKDGDNSTYPSYLGVKNFLVASYGYDNKDDILKYYFDAKSALNIYTTKYTFNEWIFQSVDGDGNDTYSIDVDAFNGDILKNLYKIANTKYEDIFSLDVDHLLINIDDDGDGNPDDPDQFILKNKDAKDKFEQDVVALVKEIYQEAIYINNNYEENTYHNVLKYIIDNYNKGAEILFEKDKGNYVSWDEFNTFNFLLTTEQLASSSDITEESVSNFVVPFQNYLKDLYKTCANTDEENPDYGITDVESEYTNGAFYIVKYNSEDKKIGEVLTEQDQADDITIDTLCKTVYGYHLLILNSYDGPDSLRYVKDTSNKVKVILRSYKDDDGNKIENYIDTDVYNANVKTASQTQFFVYYVQKVNSQESSLDSTISTIIGKMADEIINKYTSNNFQNYLLLSKLEINFIDLDIDGYKLDNNIITAKINNYKNLVLDYEMDSEYTSWVDGTLSWTRPDGK